MGGGDWGNVGQNAFRGSLLTRAGGMRSLSRTVYPTHKIPANAKLQFINLLSLPHFKTEKNSIFATRFITKMAIKSSTRVYDLCILQTLIAFKDFLKNSTRFGKLEVFD
jgi:hypothetical protein